MEESSKSNEDCSAIEPCDKWIVRSWKVRRSFALSLTAGVLAFAIFLATSGEQLTGIAAGIITAFFSFWIQVLFRRRQFLVLLSIGLGVIAASLIFITTGWYVLTTVAGLIAFATSLSAVVLYKRRAKVSLLFTACVLPAIVAIVCWGWLQLAPFRKRSKAYEVVFKADLDFQSVRSKEEGEWIWEKQGSIPSWLIKLSGGHATTHLKILQGKIENFQSADIYALELEALDSVYIVKSVDSPELSPEMVEWLIGCPQLSLVNLDFPTVSEAEISLIERLGNCERIKNLEMRLNLNRCDDHIDLTRLPRKMFARVSVDELSVSHASQFSSMEALAIETQSTSSEAIQELTGIKRLWFVGCTFESESAKAFTKISTLALVLDGCKFPNDFEIPSAQSEKRHVGRMDLINTPIQASPLTQWLTAANVKRISLPRPADKTSEEQLTKLLSAVQVLESADFVSVVDAQGNRRFDPVPLTPMR